MINKSIKKNQYFFIKQSNNIEIFIKIKIDKLIYKKFYYHKNFLLLQTMQKKKFVTLCISNLNDRY